MYYHFFCFIALLQYAVLESTEQKQEKLSYYFDEMSTTNIKQYWGTKKDKSLNKEKKFIRYIISFIINIKTQHLWNPKVRRKRFKDFIRNENLTLTRPLTFCLSIFFMHSRSVTSDIPPWTTKTFLSIIVPKGIHLYAESIMRRIFSALCLYLDLTSFTNPYLKHKIQTHFQGIIFIMKFLKGYTFLSWSVTI